MSRCRRRREGLRPRQVRRLTDDRIVERLFDVDGVCMTFLPVGFGFFPGPGCGCLRLLMIRPLEFLMDFGAGSWGRCRVVPGMAPLVRGLQYCYVSVTARCLFAQ